MADVRVEDDLEERRDDYAPRRLGIAALASDSVIYGGTRALLKSLSFLLIPLVAHYVSPAEIGRLAVVLALVAIVDVFITAGMNGVFARFYFDRDQEGWRREIITLYMLIETVYPAVIVLPLIAASGSLSDRIFGVETYASFFVIALIDVYLTNIVDLPMSLTRLRRRRRRFVVYSLTRGLTQILFTVLLVAVWHLGVKGILVASLIAVCVAAVVTLPEYVFDLTRRVNWRVGLDMIHFAWPGIIGGVAFYALGYLDRFFVRHFHGDTDTGLYEIAFRYAQVIVVAVLAFRMGWTPWHYPWLRSGRHKNMVARSALYYFFGTGLLVVLLAAWIVPVFHLLMPDSDLDAAPAVAPLALAALVSGTYTLFAVGLNVTKRMRLLGPLALVGGAIAVGLYFLLIPPFSFIGAAWATVAAFSCLAVLVLVVSDRIYPVPWDWRSIGLVLGLTVGAALLSLGIDSWMPLAASIPVRFGITLAFPVLLYALGFFPPGDLRAARSRFRKVLRHA